MALYEYEGKRPEVPSDSFVHPLAVVIGDVKIGHECFIAPGVSIRADFGPVTIGNRTSIQDNVIIHVFPASKVEIGDDVTIAHGVILHDARINSRCVIGMGSMVLFNVVCEEDVFVAAGSVIPKGMHIPAGKNIAGNPAEVTHVVTENQKLLAKAGVDYYRNLAKKYLTTMKEVK
ncbi:MAG TPA: gamma carbonic anhydrase family protein [Deltaproteobacteria bacterium]|nr:gamma carbonic anhydrase family protein [Deltaproteobacteria bacterium]